MRSVQTNKLTFRSEVGATSLAQESLVRRTSWVPEAEHLVEHGFEMVANGEKVKRS
jgi:hypothetical protein